MVINHALTNWDDPPSTCNPGRHPSGDHPRPDEVNERNEGCQGEKTPEGGEKKGGAKNHQNGQMENQIPKIYSFWGNLLFTQDP